MKIEKHSLLIMTFMLFGCGTHGESNVKTHSLTEPSENIFSQVSSHEMKTDSSSDSFSNGVYKSVWVDGRSNSQYLSDIKVKDWANSSKMLTAKVWVSKKYPAVNMSIKLDKSDSAYIGTSNFSLYFEDQDISCTYDYDIKVVVDKTKLWIMDAVPSEIGLLSNGCPNRDEQVLSRRAHANPYRQLKNEKKSIEVSFSERATDEVEFNLDSMGTVTNLVLCRKGFHRELNIDIKKDSFSQERTQTRNSCYSFGDLSGASKKGKWNLKAKISWKGEFEPWKETLFLHFESFSD